MLKKVTFIMSKDKAFCRLWSQGHTVDQHAANVRWRWFSQWSQILPNWHSPPKWQAGLASLRVHIAWLACLWVTPTKLLCELGAPAEEKHQLAHECARFMFMSNAHHSPHVMCVVCLAHTLTMLTCSLIVDSSYGPTRQLRAWRPSSIVPSPTASYYEHCRG